VVSEYLIRLICKKKDNFTIFRCTIGLSDGTNPDEHPKYFIPIHYYYACWLAGEEHRFEYPEGAIRPRRVDGINVHGCGLVLDPKNKLSIFFTLNGILLGECWR
jgi:hypothetical protein